MSYHSNNSYPWLLFHYTHSLTHLHNQSINQSINSPFNQSINQAKYQDTMHLELHYLYLLVNSHENRVARGFTKSRLPFGMQA